MKTNERKILVVKKFWFGNIQIGFKSQRLLYKVSCTELGTPHETQSYLHYQTKIIIWEWERYREERDWWNPVYKSVLRIFPLFYVALSVCASLFCSLYVFAVCIFALSFCIYLLFFSSLFSLSFFFSSCLPLFIERLRRSCSLLFLSTDQIME